MNWDRTQGGSDDLWPCSVFTSRLIFSAVLQILELTIPNSAHIVDLLLIHLWISKEEHRAIIIIIS